LLAEGVGVRDLGDGDAVCAVRGEELVLLEEREERVVLELQSAAEDHRSSFAEILLEEFLGGGQAGPDLQDVTLRLVAANLSISDWLRIPTAVEVASLTSGGGGTIQSRLLLSLLCRSCSISGLGLGWLVSRGEVGQQTALLQRERDTKLIVESKHQPREGRLVAISHDGIVDREEASPIRRGQTLER
jgi:hypothetical protein